MKRTPRGKVENLPKWAQDHIRLLTADLEVAQQRIVSMAGDVNEGTRVFVERLTDENHIPLLTRDTIGFAIGGRNAYHARVRRIPPDDHKRATDLERLPRIEVHTSAPAIVMMKASNVVEIWDNAALRQRTLDREAYADDLASEAARGNL